MTSRKPSWYKVVRGTAVAAILATSVTSTAFAKDQLRRSYDIRAQSLSSALKAVAARSNMEVLFPADVVAGKAAPALHGSYTAVEAVRALLADGSLAVEVDGKAILVRRRSETGPATDSSAVPDEDIVVTGSRIRGGVPTSPVIVLTQRAIVAAGQATVAEALRSIPQNFSGGQNPGVAFGASQTNIANANVSGGSAINLRGLGPDATLTLINGHRLAYDGIAQGVDVSAIPLPALDRIEIVADGASAIYGSDAVAGVANILLKRDFDGISTITRIGAATDGGDFEQQYGAVAGTRWSSGGVIATYNFIHASAIGTNQRSFTQTVLGPQSLLPAQSSHSAIVSGHQNLSAQLNFTIDGLYSHRETRSLTSLPTVIGRTVTQSTSYSIAPTLTGTLGRWTASVMGSYGQDDVDSVVSYTLRSTGAAASTVPSAYHNQNVTGEANAEGPLFALPGGDIRAAIGSGYRENRFRTAGGTAGKRHSAYAYGELNLPLIAPVNAVPGISRLTATAAIRHERYRDLGAVTTPKFGIVYAPSPDLDLKAAWGKSFKAPTFVQQFSNAGAYLYPVSSLGGTGFPATATALLAYGGNPDLKPERATTWTATLALHPSAVPALRAEASYFHIDYKDRIVQPVNYTAAFSNADYRQFLTYAPSISQLQAVIERGVGGLQNFSGQAYDPAGVVAIVNDYYTNVAVQKIHGVDLTVSYRFRVGQGDLGLESNASWITSSQKSIPDTAATSLAGTVFNPPHFRTRSGASFEQGAASGTIFLNHLSGVLDNRSVPVSHGNSFTTFDAAFKWTFTLPAVVKSLDAGVSVQNITNAAPPYLRSSTAYYVAYDSTNYSALGRTVAFTVSAQW